MSGGCVIYKSGMKNGIPKSSIALFLAAPLALVYFTVFILMSDGQPVPESLYRFNYGAVLLLIIGIGSIFYRAAIGAGSIRMFFWTAVPTIIILTGGSVLSGTGLHRDFYSAAFQYLLSAPVVLLAYIVVGNRDKEQLSRGTLIALSRAGMVLSVLYAQWIIFMGYAVVVRLEPRPLQSMVYNLYNIALVLLLFLLSRVVGTKAYRTMVIAQQRVYADGKDLALLVGDQKAAAIAFFARAPNLTLRCTDLQVLSEAVVSRTDRDKCEQCVNSNAKATLCPKYRNTYNNILEIKKALEFLEIGTITSPDNKRSILDKGWKLCLFQNTRIKIH